MNGSSPRVRSRRTVTFKAGSGSGIISACAEQTRRWHDVQQATGDHLRVCGADNVTLPELPAPTGSSPRVRSRQDHRQHGRGPAGIISACAEQTDLTSGEQNSTRDHLRVCGADDIMICFHCSDLGSSPRVRSRHHRPDPQTAPRRIISACAEQTCSTAVAYSR